MMKEEAVWIGSRFLNVVKDSGHFRLLNLGSSTKDFREVRFPYIYKEIFEPLQKKGVKVDHLDLKKDEGVDIVGDLTDRNFLDVLKSNNYDGALCNNLLEHVSNPDEICLCLEESVKKGGNIIITVPHVFPYHQDPVDTMFRPGIDELKSKFPNSDLIDAEILVVPDNHLKLLLRNKKLFFLTLARVVLPFYKFRDWKKIISDVPHLFKNFQVTCILLRKRL